MGTRIKFYVLVDETGEEMRRISHNFTPNKHCRIKLTDKDVPVQGA
jgi:hypothetical protein